MSGQTSTRKENYRPTYFIKMNAKNPQKYFLSQIQQDVEEITQHDQVGVASQVQRGLNINQCDPLQSENK